MRMVAEIAYNHNSNTRLGINWFLLFSIKNVNKQNKCQNKCQICFLYSSTIGVVRKNLRTEN